MKTKGFAYQFTGKELMFVLFGRKLCPECGEKLTRQKQENIVDGKSISSVSTPLYIQGRKVKKYNYIYCCKNCKNEYNLSQLAKK